MCIRDSPQPYLEQILLALKGAGLVRSKRGVGCLLYTSDAADDLTRVDLGGRLVTFGWAMAEDLAGGKLGGR